MLDLFGVESCDAAALQLLCAARKSAACSGRRVQVRGISGAVEMTAAALGLSLEELCGRKGARGYNPVATFLQEAEELLAVIEECAAAAETLRGGPAGLS
jgi:STAS domain